MVGGGRKIQRKGNLRNSVGLGSSKLTVCVMVMKMVILLVVMMMI